MASSVVADHSELDCGENKVEEASGDVTADSKLDCGRTTVVGLKIDRTGNVDRTTNVEVSSVAETGDVCNRSVLLEALNGVSNESTRTIIEMCIADVR